MTGNEAGVQATRQWVVPGVHTRRAGTLYTLVPCTVMVTRPSFYEKAHSNDGVQPLQGGTLRSVPPGLGFPTSKLALLCLAHQDLKRVWVRTLKRDSEDFPGGPVVRICTSTAGLVGSIPGEETKIPNAMQHSQKFFKVFFILKNK